MVDTMSDHGDISAFDGHECLEQEHESCKDKHQRNNILDLDQAHDIPADLLPYLHLLKCTVAFGAINDKINGKTPKVEFDLCEESDSGVSDSDTDDDSDSMYNDGEFYNYLLSGRQQYMSEVQPSVGIESVGTGFMPRLQHDLPDVASVSTASTIHIDQVGIETTDRSMEHGDIKETDGIWDDKGEDASKRTGNGGRTCNVGGNVQKKMGFFKRLGSFCKFLFCCKVPKDDDHSESEIVVITY